MTDDEALETLFAMANVQDGYAKKATDPGLKVIHKANAKAQREVAATIKDLRARLASTTAERDAAVSEAQRLREALDYWKHKHSVLQDLATEHGTATAKNTNALTASLAEAEAERADEWRRRRDADASRDAAKAACETMRAERDAALAQVEKLREARRDQMEARVEAVLRRNFVAPEDAAVEALCLRFGYGAVMDAASRLWARTDMLGAFYVGGCIGFRTEEEARAALDEDARHA